MLSERERRAFAEIEEGIAGHDPRFAALMRRLVAGAYRGHDAVIAMATATALLCVLLSLPGAAVVAAALAAAAGFCRPRHPPLRLRGGPAHERGGAHR